MPSRRTFLLGAGAGVAAAAGCVSTGGDGDPDGTSTPTATPIGTPTDRPSGEVTLEDIGVRKAVTYRSLMGSSGVLAAEGRQYVVASVTADREVAASAFAFEAGGDAWAPGHGTTAGSVNRSLAGREGVPLGYGGYDPGQDAYLAFVVPSPMSASTPEITFEGDDAGPWPLEDTDRETLAAPEPTFELASLSVPDEVSEGETLDVELEARNVSETDGRFLAALYWPTHQVADDDESTILEREIAAGEVATLSRSIDTRYTDDEDRSNDLRVRGHVEASREVQFRTN